MNLVLVVYAFMAAFLVVFQHRLDNGTFGRGASRAVDSGTILVNPTDAVAIYSPRCHGASKYESLTAVALSNTL